jgi:uncharacterized FlgJ-related protein
MKIFYWNKKNLEMKNVSILIISIVVVVTLIMIKVGYLYGVSEGKKEEITEKDVILLYQEAENNSFTRKKFYEYLKEVNIKFPKLVFAQAMKECGFKSPKFKNNNNPFGMKEATQRPNTQSGTENGYAYYTTWKTSITDYALYQAYMGLSRIKTEDAYLAYLKEMNYYDTESPANEDYLKDLKYIADHIEDYIKE